MVPWLSEAPVRGNGACQASIKGKFSSNPGLKNGIAKIDGISGGFTLLLGTISSYITTISPQHGDGYVKAQKLNRSWANPMPSEVASKNVVVTGIAIDGHFGCEITPI